MMCCVLKSAAGLALWTLSATVSAVTLGDVPVPYGTKVEVVSTDTVHNGNALSLATYQSNLSLEQTADFYRKVWADSEDENLPGMLETRSDQWLMLSRVRDGYNTVIQLSLAEPFRGSGYLSIMSLTATSSFQGYGDRIPGLQLLSNTASNDGARSSTVSVYLSGESVGTTSESFSRYLISKSWALVSSHDYQQNKVMLFNRGRSQIELVVGTTQERDTLVVMNEVEDRG